VIYGPVLPGSWADDPSLPTPQRDTAAAKRLIEGAGWTLGADGVYVKDGRPLAAEIVTRAGKDDRVRMTDLAVKQARDCGMNLRRHPAPWDTIFSPSADAHVMLNYPHDIPGTTTPFDLYIGGYSNSPDPADGMGVFASSQVTTREQPDGSNFGGFADPALDRLIAQQELAAQVPVIFLWDLAATDLVRSAVATVDGPLDLAAPNWAAQPERLVVAPPGN
jgi:peptide/nickel transport system substrate-binding protein